jgi:hypothetical protein
MTERPYETTVPDDLTTGTASTSTTSAAPMGSTSVSESSTSGYAGTGSGATTGTASGAANGSDAGSMASSVGSEAKSVAADAADSGRDVAATAASGAKDVAAEASTQLRGLFSQLRGELDDQASSQGQRAASGLRSLADELHQMASSSSQQGMAGEVASQAADRARSAADWMENRQPADMLDELRSFARRRPGAFLLGAAVLGVIGGRMTRGLTGDSGGFGGTSQGLDRTIGSPYAAGGVTTSVGVDPSVSPVRREPYTVGVRDSDTHAVTSMTDGVTSEDFDEGITEGRGGVS